MDDCCRLLLELLLDGLQLAEDVGSLRAWACSPEELQRRLREQRVRVRVRVRVRG